MIFPCMEANMTGNACGCAHQPFIMNRLAGEGGVTERTVIVLGAGGQLGLELQRAAPPAGFAVVALGRADADLTDAGTLAAAVARPGVAAVINAAAYTAVDKAESEPDAAFAINRDGPARLAEACRAAAVPMLHVSTDYVFDGTKDGAYVEDDPVCPVGVYGASKAAGEAAVRAALDRHLIARTAWVYSPFRGNFVKTMLRVGAERPVLRVVDDQHGCPTAAADLAAALLAMAARAVRDDFTAWGTYHVCGTGRTTWCGFARAIFAEAAAYDHPVPRIEAITTADYPTPARRPANSVLATDRLGAVFGIALPPWRTSLRACLEELLAPAAAGRP